MYMNDGNGIYERFNIQRPADFTGHSLSVSDVVVLNDGSTVKAYYVDSIGFAELPEFFKERNMDLQKENLLNEELQEIEIFDKPGLFSNGRLRDEEVPEGLYRYDLRGSDYDPGQPITVEKTVVVNHDCMATCGTINLDYRSLYHHFENGCFMADCQAVVEIKNDLIRTMAECRDVTDQYQTGRSAYLRLGQLFMRLFAGLL